MSHPRSQRYRASTTGTITAGSARYIRRSAIVWVMIGTTLEVGARIAKNQAPAKPRTGRRRRATAVARTRAITTAPHERRTAGLRTR